MKRLSFFLPAFLLSASGLVACGGSDDGSEEETELSSTSGSETSREPDDGLGITGLMGTIRPDQVENALHPRMGRFQRCFMERMNTVELLGGNIRLAFRIHVDGSVAWVYPSETDIGDRETEQCVLTVARGTHFRPRGGEAEFGWGFGLDPADDLRPPLNWAADALGRAADDMRALGRRCGARGPGHTITAYISPGGEVLAAGGTMPDQDAEQALDCILEGVRGTSMPDPGSYPAKITFTVR